MRKLHLNKRVCLPGQSWKQAGADSQAGGFQGRQDTDQTPWAAEGLQPCREIDLCSRFPHGPDAQGQLVWDTLLPALRTNPQTQCAYCYRKE